MYRRGLSMGDIAVTIGGVGLAVACAAFPWYVFLNQDQFGVREMRFSGNMTPGRPDPAVTQPLVMQSMTSEDFPIMELDLLTTATTTPDLPRQVPTEQPFPDRLRDYRLIHVANGRAMIEDGDGLFVVQPGALLPDAETVASIEQRDGAWVLVTSTGGVLRVE
jgi:hypothetical protein